MLLRTAAIVLLGLSASQVRAADPPAAPATSASAVKEIADVEEYVKRSRDVVRLAQAGEYGKLTDHDLDRLADAQRDIELLFGNRKGAAAINEDQQIRLANDQEVINAVVRRDDKSRVICSQIQKTGTRLTTRECLTVAQREARARAAREKAEALQGNFCTPGEGQSCTVQ